MTSRAAKLRQPAAGSRHAGSDEGTAAFVADLDAAAARGSQSFDSIAVPAVPPDFSVEEFCGPDDAAQSIRTSGLHVHDGGLTEIQRVPEGTASNPGHRDMGIEAGSGEMRLVEGGAAVPQQCHEAAVQVGQGGRRLDQRHRNVAGIAETCVLARSQVKPPLLRQARADRLHHSRKFGVDDECRSCCDVQRPGFERVRRTQLQRFQGKDDDQSGQGSTSSRLVWLVHGHQNRRQEGGAAARRFS